MPSQFDVFNSTAGRNSGFRRDRKRDARWNVCNPSGKPLALGSAHRAGLWIAGVLLLSMLPVPAWAQGAQTLPVQSMHLLNTSNGWVAGPNSLWRTEDAGQHWKEMTPPGQEARSIQSVYFLNPQNGWVVSGSNTAQKQEAGPFVLSSTSDGGQAWTTAPLNVRVEEGSTAVAINFVDPQHGWIMLRLPSSSNFSRGMLLSTTDAGKTWNVLPSPPIADAIRFVSPSTGWLAGGPAGDQLYVTRDGGSHWERQSVPPDAAGDNANPQSYRLPAFENDHDGTLVTVSNEDTAAQLRVFETHDGGLTWTLKTTASLGEEASHAAISVVNSGTVFVAPANRVGLVALGPGALHIDSALFRSISPDQAISKLDFVNAQQGWVLVSGGVCENGKSNCHQESKLLATNDGGRTTTDITPIVTVHPQSTPPSQAPPHEQEAQAAPEPESPEAVPQAVVAGQGKGFDQCAAGTVSQMQAWWTNTPWNYANIYIGGSNRGCRQPHLNASWVSDIFRQGWKLIPTWVGPQASTTSCHRCSSRISTDVNTAAEQGIAEANKASQVAHSLGLPSPTIIYYDMEEYSGRSPAVRAFINAWVRRLQQLGDEAGVYGSGSNAAEDWAPLANPPDAVWIANWNRNPSVFNLSGLPNTLWPNHQRIHQYIGPHNETWGGVTFNIDTDNADGPLADDHPLPCVRCQ